MKTVKRYVVSIIYSGTPTVEESNAVLDDAVQQMLARESPYISHVSVQLIEDVLSIPPKEDE